MSKQKKSTKQKIYLILAIAFLILAVIIFLLGKIFDINLFEDKNIGVISKADLTTMDFDKVSQDTLYITKDREEYRKGLMRLVIPKIILDTPIGENTLPDDLEKMPGLYEFAQMPSHGDVNVSIAGHRDIGHLEFYKLDKVQAGDHMYLVFEDTIYKYEFYSSNVVNADAWEVIKRQGFSALTLTTCDPIGTRLNRLVVVGKLVDSYTDTDDFEFV